MELLFSLAVLLIALGGILIIVGAVRLAVKLIVAAVVLVVFLPLILCLLAGILPAVSLPSGMWLLLLLIPVLIAFIKFTNHRRSYQEWTSAEDRVSLKRRLEKD